MTNARIRLQEESKERASGGENATGLGGAASAGRWDWGIRRSDWGGGTGEVVSTMFVEKTESDSHTQCQWPRWQRQLGWSPSLRTQLESCMLGQRMSRQGSQ